MLLGDFLIFFFFLQWTHYFYNQKKKKRILNKRKNSVLPHRKLPALPGLRGRSGVQFATEFCDLVLSLRLSFNGNDPILQMDEKTKAQKREFCPVLLSQLVMELVLEHGSPDSPAMWKGIQSPASSADSEFSITRSNQKPRLTSQNSYSKDFLCMHEMPSKDSPNVVIL